jgi:uncharacterized protein (TIGR03083 family)
MDTRQLAREADGVANHDAYRRIRHNVTQLVTAHSSTEDETIPSCPDWTVCDLVAHLVGISAFAIGRMSGTIPSRRSSNSCADVVAMLGEWDWMGPEAERLIARHGGQRGNLIVMDSFTHELDLRYTLGEPLPAADHPAFARAFQVLLHGFSASVIAHNLPPLTIVVDGQEWCAGLGDPVATLTADRYDAYRSLAGRRSHDQITQLGWSRDSHRWLPAFTWGPFTPPPVATEPLCAGRC